MNMEMQKKTPDWIYVTRVINAWVKYHKLPHTIPLFSMTTLGSRMEVILEMEQQGLLKIIKRMKHSNRYSYRVKILKPIDMDTWYDFSRKGLFFSSFNGKIEFKSKETRVRLGSKEHQVLFSILTSKLPLSNDDIGRIIRQPNKKRIYDFMSDLRRKIGIRKKDGILTAENQYQI